MRFQFLFASLLNGLRVERVHVYIATWAARAHLLIGASPDGKSVKENGQSVGFCKIRTAATAVLCVAMRALARACVRAAYAGRPLTPAGYAIVALMLAAIVLVVLLSAFAASAGLNRGFRMNMWPL
jgi:hypothetical protein